MGFARDALSAFLPHLQKRCETIQLWSGFSSFSMVDSSVSRQIPTFRLKNRRTFAPFTTGGKKPVGFNAILQALNRKQIPVCTTCHQKIHRGDYDGMNLSDLAYNPYGSEKRRRFRESRMR